MMEPCFPLEILICPECKQDSLKPHTFQRKGERNQDGILVCEVCKNWFIIEDNILEFLKTDINKDRKAVFSHQYEKELTDLNLNFDEIENTVITQEISQKRGQSEFFNNFEENYPIESQNFWLAYYRMTIDEFSKKTRPHSRILDFGCGTGLGALPFLNGKHSVVGIDISRNMLKKAIARVPEAQRGRHFFFVADAEELPFKKDTFDYCVGMGILHHLHNPRRAIQSVYNCLKSEGIYFGHENNKTFLRPLFDLLMKFCTLWEEEAGEEQLLSMENIKSLYSNFMVEIKTHVFLPPHIFNLFNLETTYNFLRISDSFFSTIPLLKNHGGTIVFEAKKEENSKSILREDQFQNKKM